MTPADAFVWGASTCQPAARIAELDRPPGQWYANIWAAAGCLTCLGKGEARYLRQDVRGHTFWRLGQEIVEIERTP